MSIKVTRVVNIRGGRNRDITTEDGFDIYIGRPGNWGNPFRMGEHGTRGEVCDKHMEWLDGKREAPNGQKPPTKEEIKKRLTGRRLGCFCAPKRCHGDNYVAICRGKHG